MSAVLSFPAAAMRDELPLSLPLELIVRDGETISELCAYPEGEVRDEFALKALRIGVLALKQARGQIDGDLVRREGDRLLTTSCKPNWHAHAKAVDDRTATHAPRVFPPSNRAGSRSA